MTRKILVLGGDGFCGWPTTLALSARGHDVQIVDDLSRRRIDVELGSDSLTPLSDTQTRLSRWQAVSGRTIQWHRIDVAREYDRLAELIASEKPDAIVHFAEQRAAPYSMRSDRHRRYTVDSNVNATHNVLAALVSTGRDAHLVHLGTMGVYGYGTPGMEIPEGYLHMFTRDTNGDLVEQEILYPANPGSIYHMTKTLDQLLFLFYAKNDGVRITDLHQGVVWGTETNETRLHPELINRFDYDGDYGTVLNRFLVQAAVGHPLTVHGTGGQTRAFIHIQNTTDCVALAIENPPARGDRVKIMNQLTETHRVRDLAALVSRLTGAEIAFLNNPRKESESNELHASNSTLLSLGLAPITLEEGLVTEIVDVARRFGDRCDKSKIPSVARW